MNLYLYPFNDYKIYYIDIVLLEIMLCCNLTSNVPYSKYMYWCCSMLKGNIGKTSIFIFPIRISLALNMCGHARN